MKLKSCSVCLWLGFLIAGCSGIADYRNENTDAPSVKHSVLDQQTRMITLNFNDTEFAAYNKAQCSLVKLWKGGVHWDGANFNNIKTVQPESWGPAYVDNSLSSNPWKLISKCDTLNVSLQFRSYVFRNNKVVLEYELTTPDNTNIKIKETPELVVQDDQTVVFSRTFSTSGMDPNTRILNGDIVLPVNGVLAVEKRFVRYKELETPTRLVSGSGSQYWLDRSGCNTCHEMDEQTIGPSWLQIAKRYDDDEETIHSLVIKVKNGGSGNWGTVPMQPHPQLSEEVIQDMLHYILSLHNEGSKEEDEVPDEEDWEETGLEKSKKPGFGSALIGVHPNLLVQTIHPSWLKPRVGGMDFLPDGRLLVSTWDSIGAVYALKGVETGDTNQIEVTRIAEGLAEPLGLKSVGDEVYVLQKQELTQLLDNDQDGITDEYRTLCDDWGVTADFHEFSYGLEFKDGYFYAGLGLAMRLMPQELQDPDRGTLIRISPSGEFEKIMTGLRQPNGIGYGPNEDLFITENQGQWVPACKFMHVREGFYGCQYGTGNRYAGLKETQPAVWLPQDEIGNSPGQPVQIPKGIYRGQMLHGEVTHGGLKRVFLEKVAGEYQGAAFRFTQGLEAGIIRSVIGPDSALYVGGVGMNGNWGWKGRQYGLQRLEFTDNIPFELLKVEATSTGFTLTFTKPIMDGMGEDPDDYFIQTWHYKTTPEYGGPKLDLHELTKSVSISEDRREVTLTIKELNAGYVVYFLLNDQLKSQQNESLWTGEAWYTLNNIP